MQSPMIVDLHCRHCGHTWIPRKKKTPDRCPACQKLYPIEDVKTFDATYAKTEKPADNALSSATAGEMEYLVGVLEIMRAGDPAIAKWIREIVDARKGPPLK